MAKAKYPGPVEALEQFEALVARHPDVARKGAKTPYTSRNGHMFSFLTVEGMLAIRLSDDDGSAFVEQYESGPVLQHGRTMRGYVAVPDVLFGDLDSLSPWFGRSSEWIGTLKPK